MRFLIPIIVFLSSHGFVVDAAAENPSGTANAAQAASFMDSFSGDWHGTGRVLLGKQTGLTFHCMLDGTGGSNRLAFAMTGRCWMGWIGAPVHAQIRFDPEENRYHGDFWGGGEDHGIDISGAQTPEGLDLRLSREDQRGQLIVKPVGDDRMHVIISILDRKNERHVPVVAMGFARRSTLFPDGLESQPTGLLARLLKNKSGDTR